MQLIHTGSVKNIYATEGAALLVFEFSDRYSVFDWGHMPDHLDGKGVALATMAQFFFEQLEQRGIAHHAVGLCNAQGSLLQKGELSRYLAVKPVQVPRGQTDAYQKRPISTLVPLEILFRFGIPEGSSLISRSQDRQVQEDLGLTGPVVLGQRFAKPLIEFSTKLEATDRMLSYAEARELAGLLPEEFTSLVELTQKIAESLRELWSKIGVELWDGKIELAFGERGSEGARTFLLVDSVGPDELRLVSEGVSLSKEILRQYYRHTEWFPKQLEAKKMARERGGDWKRICREELQGLPENLPPELKQRVQDLYLILADELLVSQGQQRQLAPKRNLKEWLKEAREEQS